MNRKWSIFSNEWGSSIPEISRKDHPPRLEKPIDIDPNGIWPESVADNCDDMTLEQIGELDGICRQAVHLVLARAIEKCRRGNRMMRLKPYWDDESWFKTMRARE